MTQGRSSSGDGGAAERFAGRRAAVTGAGGFIGDAVTRRLLAEGAAVVGLDRDPAAAERISDAGAEHALADVTDRASLDRALAGAELVVHTAAYVHEWGEMEDFVEVNVRGTANVLDAARAAGAERIVHISSVVVYGYDAAGELDESAFRRSYGIPYIDTKAASDRLACERGAVVIRPGDVYGPRGSQWVVRPLEMAKAGQLAVAAGGGMMMPVYVDDLVEAIVLGLERGRAGEAYTVWQEQPVTFEEHFSQIAQIAGARPPRRLPRAVLTLVGGAMETAAKLRGRTPAFTSRAVTFIDRRGTASTAKARDELGWRPQVPYDEGVRRTAQWARAAGLAG